MVSHKEFVDAGKKPGLQVWRIENLDLKPVPKALHGSFFTGDAYLLLFTTSAPSYNIHMWLGDECSQDESGAVAIFSTQLDDFLGGGPVQYRELQNAESNTFLGYFKSGIKYQVSWGRGLRFSACGDKRHEREAATEVEMSWGSFNKGDCFIVDLGKDIYQWCGSECNRFERLKASGVGIDIRDNERNGRAKLHMVEEGEEPAAIIEVTQSNLSWYISQPHVEDFTSKLITCETKVKKGALYMISDNSGSMKVSAVSPSSPFKQAMLSPEECFILDNGVDNNIFVWKGPKANSAERKAAMSVGQQFIKDKGYSNKTQVRLRVAPTRKQTHYFPQEVRRLCSSSSSIWRVEGERVPVDPSLYGHFYGGDCYLILYSYRLSGREQHIIYTWQGLKCTQDELAASAFLTVKLDDSMGGSPVQVRVTQGQEPPHLMSLFQGKPMIIHSGALASSTSVRAPPALPGLWSVCASNLNTNDVFVLKSPSALYVWRGVGASDEELAASKHVVAFLGGNAQSVSEGSEPADFWAALGGKKGYQTSKSLQNTVKAPRLFGCSNKTGRLTVEEVPGDFNQSDLAIDDVMLLDTWEQIFLWVGNDANAEERTGAPKIAKEYVDTDPSGRKGLPITTIKQGAEPPTFTGWFQAWDPKMWEMNPLDRIRARFQA
uniref:Scinderin like b n=1 Tax=Gasterosteus aculeatus aculeatus TaxID=481459 RepID=A0AAQ4PMM2_GASAC